METLGIFKGTPKSSTYAFLWLIMNLQDVGSRNPLSATLALLSICLQWRHGDVIMARKGKN